MVDHDGTVVPEGKFTAIYKPPSTSPPIKSQITGIPNDTVKNSKGFDEVGPITAHFHHF
jgi:DNA polymerase III epsilon subunit-like protein